MLFVFCKQASSRKRSWRCWGRPQEQEPGSMLEPQRLLFPAALPLQPGCSALLQNTHCLRSKPAPVGYLTTATSQVFPSISTYIFSGLCLLYCSLIEYFACKAPVWSSPPFPLLPVPAPAQLPEPEEQGQEQTGFCPQNYALPIHCPCLRCTRLDLKSVKPTVIFAV